MPNLMSQLMQQSGQKQHHAWLLNEHSQSTSMHPRESSGCKTSFAWLLQVSVPKQYPTMLWQGAAQAQAAYTLRIGSPSQVWIDELKLNASKQAKNSLNFKVESHNEVPSPLGMNLIWWRKSTACFNTVKFKGQRCSMLDLIPFEIWFFVDI